MYDADGLPRCDMRTECTSPVTHIDESGFIYCTTHGQARQAWKRCRKMRPHELNRIKRGEPVARY